MFCRCAHNQGSMGSGETRYFLCSQAIKGRYVFISLRGKNVLTLCEVEVFQSGM